MFGSIGMPELIIIFVIALIIFGPRKLRASVPAAIVIQFLGGIHEIYFPYILMKPRLILAAIAGGMSGIAVFEVTGAGLVASPSPGSIFAYVRWAANDFGTVVSRIDILRAVMPGEAFSTVRYVRPGGEIFLRLSGWPRVERVLQAIDAVEQLGVDPADACPDHWRQLHNRLASGEPPRAYTAERHRAWLLRRSIDA